jgi:hypothetical protein
VLCVTVNVQGALQCHSSDKNVFRFRASALAATFMKRIPKKSVRKLHEFATVGGFFSTVESEMNESDLICAPKCICIRYIPNYQSSIIRCSQTVLEKNDYICLHILADI